MKRILCTCSENWVWPELSIPAAGQIVGSGDENVDTVAHDCETSEMKI